MNPHTIAIPKAEPAPLTSDETLMRRYAAGDAGAFDALYARHRGPLYRYMLRGCGDAEVAGELFQDVWARLIRGRARYRVKARFTTYLFRIAHNRLVDHYRSVRPTDALAAETAAPAADQPEMRAAGNETAARLLAAIHSLPLDQREAILLKEERGLSLAEIAQVTNVGRETVKSRLRYALAKLREALPDE